jgi:hypothetical protein
MATTSPPATADELLTEARALWEQLTGFDSPAARLERLFYGPRLPSDAVELEQLLGAVREMFGFGALPRDPAGDAAAARALGRRIAGASTLESALGAIMVQLHDHTDALAARDAGTADDPYLRESAIPTLDGASRIRLCRPETIQPDGLSLRLPIDDAVRIVLVTRLPRRHALAEVLPYQSERHGEIVVLGPRDERGWYRLSTVRELTARLHAARVAREEREARERAEREARRRAEWLDSDEGQRHRLRELEESLAKLTAQGGAK